MRRVASFNTFRDELLDEVRPELLRGVILSGGSTLFPGLLERLSRELEARVIAPADRRCLPWVGGSILASLQSMKGLWISEVD